MNVEKVLLACGIFVILKMFSVSENSVSVFTLQLPSSNADAKKIRDGYENILTFNKYDLFFIIIYTNYIYIIIDKCVRNRVLKRIAMFLLTTIFITDLVETVLMLKNVGPNMTLEDTFKWQRFTKLKYTSMGLIYMILQHVFRDFEGQLVYKIGTNISGTIFIISLYRNIVGDQFRLFHFYFNTFLCMFNYYKYNESL